MLLSIFTGQLFDIFGRRIVLAVNIFAMIVITIFTPYTAPSIALLTVFRCFMSVILHTIGENPFIPDYVKQASRGKAVILKMFGMMCGEALAISFMIQISARWHPNNQFLFASIVLGTIGIITIFFTREPKIKLQRPLKTEDNYQVLDDVQD
jgi:MFS family permease